MSLSVSSLAAEQTIRPHYKVIGSLGYYKWAGTLMATTADNSTIGRIYVFCDSKLNLTTALVVGDYQKIYPSFTACSIDLAKITSAKLDHPVKVYIDNFEIVRE